MDNDSLLGFLRRRMQDEVSPTSPGLTRVGRVIRRLRPALATCDLAPPDPAPLTLPQKLACWAASFRELTAAWADSVGRIDVRRGETWVAAGTAVLVYPGDAASGQGARVLTAGHVISMMLNEGEWLPCVLQPEPQALCEARISFSEDPDATDVAIGIRRVIWPHDLWDLALLELDQPVAAPAFDWGATGDGLSWSEPEPIVVLGYPLVADHPGVKKALFSKLFPGSLGIRRGSPGFCIAADEPTAMIERVADANRALLRHDASTLPGSSGSALISLRSGRLIGLHVSGGTFRYSRGEDFDAANLAVPLLRVMSAEPRLVQECRNRPDEAQRAPCQPKSRRILERHADPDHEWACPPGSVETPSLAGGALADRPDNRDLIYCPTLVPLPEVIAPQEDPQRIILDQMDRALCVGCALATALNHQRRQVNPQAPEVSARMIDGMARLHDEWIEDAAEGTSLRAGIKGLFDAGVCEERLAPLEARGAWRLTRQMARNAAQVQLGAYYRLAPRRVDFQAALAEAGAVVVSADIHSGWRHPLGKKGAIKPRGTPEGAHAFVILGYDADGFIIQNCWGPRWGGWRGQPGLAHWAYSDWAESLIDAWVLCSAPPTSNTELRVRATLPPDPALPEFLRRLAAPHRFELLGHLICSEREGVVESSGCSGGLDHLRQALGDHVASRRNAHIVVIYHDPCVEFSLTLRLCGYLTPVMLRNGIFPLHVIHGADELATLRARVASEADLIQQRFADSWRQAGPWLQRRAVQLGRRLVADLVAGTERAAAPTGPLWSVLATLRLEVEQPRLTLLSFGVGAIAAVKQWQQAGGLRQRRIRQLLQVAPVMSPAPDQRRVVEWRLPAEPEVGDIPPLAGDWADLIHAMLDQGSGQGPREAPGKASVLPRRQVASAFDSDLLNQLLQRIKGRMPPPDKRFPG